MHSDCKKRRSFVALLFAAVDLRHYRGDTMQINEKFLRITEETNAIDYLEKTAFYLEESKSSDIAWKWVTISLHGALYGFAIAASSGTDSRSVLRKNGKLLSIWDAIKRCEDPTIMCTLVHAKALTLTHDQRESIQKLTSLLRNDFSHFTPKSWSIELHGLPQISLEVLEVINFLCFETKTYILLDPDLREETKTIIDSCTGIIKNLFLYKESLLL